MAHDETQVEDAVETNAGADVDPGEASMADAVDDRAAELTGSQGDAATAPISEVNRDAVEKAEDHLDDANLADDRETLKTLQQSM